MPQVSFKTIDSVDVSGKRALVRVDLNVPMKNGQVTDATRIERAVPTLAELAAKGVVIEEATRTVLPSGIPCCVVRDPDGFAIEIVQVPSLDLVPYDVPYVAPEA